MNFKKQPWSPADATACINLLAKRGIAGLHYTDHCKERMEQRGIVIRDILYVLKTGFVYEDPEAASREGFYKYKVEGDSLSCEGRTLRIIAIVDERKEEIKIVTVMFIDE